MTTFMSCHIISSIISYQKHRTKMRLYTIGRPIVIFSFFFFFSFFFLFVERTIFYSTCDKMFGRLFSGCGPAFLFAAAQPPLADLSQLSMRLWNKKKKEGGLHEKNVKGNTGLRECF